MAVCLLLIQEQARWQRDVTMAKHARQQRLVEIRVTPRHLVPDTNCFIDHLGGVKRLLTSQRFMLVVPIIGERCCFFFFFYIRHALLHSFSHIAHVTSHKQRTPMYLMINIF